MSGGGGGKGRDHRYYSHAAAEEVKIGRKLKWLCKRTTDSVRHREKMQLGNRTSLETRPPRQSNHLWTTDRV